MRPRIPLRASSIVTFAVMLGAVGLSNARAATPLSPDGTPLTWPVPPTSTGPVIELVAWPGPGVGAEDLSRITRGALARWQAATDDAFSVRFWVGGGKPPAPAADGVSTIVFGSMVGAADSGRPATALVRSEGGVITEVDIVINDAAFAVTVDPIAADPVFGPLDLDAVLTHELGHALGLDHSGVLESTMLPWPWAGQAELACDDVAGIRAVFDRPVERITGRAVLDDGAPAGGLQALAVEAATGDVVAGMTDADGRFAIALPRPGRWAVGVAPYTPGAETLAAPQPAAPCDGRTPRQWRMADDGPAAALFEVAGGATARLGDVTVRCTLTAASGARTTHEAVDLRDDTPLAREPEPEPDPDPEPDPPDPEPDPPVEPDPAGPGEACDPLAYAPCVDGTWCDEGSPAGPVCRFEVCGDGHLGPDEECDDGNDAAGDGCEDCVAFTVGLGDDCTANGPPCDALARCDLESGQCVAHACGDGELGGDEPCDPSVDPAGCSADCQLDPFYDDGAAPDGPDGPGRLPFDAAGDARIGYALAPGEADWFALDLPYAARVAVRTIDPRGRRCPDSIVRLMPAGRPEGAPVAVGERAFDACARLDARVPAGRYLLRLGARGDDGHGPRWLRVQRRRLPAIGDDCGDPLAPCPDDAYCGPDRVCVEHVCGDGRRGPDEECDDGNQMDGDGCSADCRFAPIPIGGFCAEDPECAEGSYCGDGRCRAHRCGDAILGPDEACDDGNLDATDGCDPQCAFAVFDRFARPVTLDPTAGPRYFALTGVAGSVVVHALDWSLHGDRSVRLELLDVQGNPVPIARESAPRRTLDDGFVDQDATVVADGLPYGDYLLKLTPNALPGRLSPRNGRLRITGSPVLLVGAISPEPLPAAEPCAPVVEGVPGEALGPAPVPRRRSDDGCAVVSVRTHGGGWLVAGVLVALGLRRRLRARGA